MDKQNRSIDRIVRLDVNGFDGSLLERWKSKITNKLVGLKMVERIMNLFNINLNEIKSSGQNELDEEKKFQSEFLKKV